MSTVRHVLTRFAFILNRCFLSWLILKWLLMLMTLPWRGPAKDLPSRSLLCACAIAIQIHNSGYYVIVSCAYIRTLVLRRKIFGDVFPCNVVCYCLENMRPICRIARFFHSGRSQSTQIHLLPIRNVRSQDC
jgi:hypothetical protein